MRIEPYHSRHATRHHNTNFYYEPTEYPSRDGHEILRVAAIAEPHRLSDDVLRQLAGCYRDVFAHGAPVDPSSWGEYARCPDCGAALSFETVTGLSHYRHIEEIEALRPPPLPRCPHCGGGMGLFYQPEVLLDEVRHHFRQREIHAAVVLDREMRVRGFSYGWIDSVEKVWQEKIAAAYQKSALDWPGFVRRIGANSGGSLTPQTQVFYYAEIGLTLPSRSMNAVFGLQGAMLREVVRRRGPEAVRHLPMLSTATPQANSYAIFVAAGGKPVCEVDDNPLAVLSEPFAAFLDKMSVPPEDYFRRFRGNMKEVLRARRRMAA